MTLRLLLDQNFPRPPGFDLASVDATIEAVHVYDHDRALTEGGTPDRLIYLRAVEDGFDAPVTRDWHQMEQPEELWVLSNLRLTVVSWRKPMNDSVAEWGHLLAYLPQLKRRIERRQPRVLRLPPPQLGKGNEVNAREALGEYATEQGRAVQEVMREAPGHRLLVPRRDWALTPDGPGHEKERQRVTSAFRARRGVLAILAAAVGVLSACSNETATSTGDARRELQEAIDRTLAADSLHVEVSQSVGTDAGESGGRTSIDFNAPDRIRSVSSGDGSDSSESIVIGDTIYFSDFERDGYFMSAQHPDGQSPAENLLAPLEAIGAEEEVRIEGDEYVVRFGDPAATATLRIRDGYVVRLRLQAGARDEALDAVYEFSQFGSAAEVAAPPPDRVTEAPILPECPEDRELPEGVLVCTGGDLQEPREVDLPAPAEPVDSTLQFRPVRSAAGSSCAPRETNPPAGDAVSMQDSDGVCLDLSASELEVSRVESLRATTTDGEDVALDITLRADDARRFDEVAEEYLGQQLALVILGRVVSAPTIQATGLEGQLQISGLTMEDAAQIKAALTA